MKDIYKVLKESIVLYFNSKDNSFTQLEDLKKACKTIYTASNEDEVKQLINTHKNTLSLIISDVNISQHSPNTAFYIITNENVKTSNFLSIIAEKIIKASTNIKATKMANTLTKLLQEEKTKAQKILTFATASQSKLKVLDYVVDELLVKFEINKSGIVSSTSKNFPEIFGFREEYIVNEDISKIVHGSVLQKTLLQVTRHKKPVVEYLTFNTVTGVIIEPMVVIVPYFDNTEYLNTYTLYCTLQ